MPIPIKRFPHWSFATCAALRPPAVQLSTLVLWAAEFGLKMSFRPKIGKAPRACDMARCSRMRQLSNPLMAGWIAHAVE